jgi:hypothetical protein
MTTKWRRWFTIANLAVTALGFGYTGYVRLIVLPRLRETPPTIPCTEGMTLLPHQTCYIGIEVKVRRLGPVLPPGGLK